MDGTREYRVTSVERPAFGRPVVCAVDELDLARIRFRVTHEEAGRYERMMRDGVLFRWPEPRS